MQTENMFNFRDHERNSWLNPKRAWAWVLLAGVLSGGGSYLYMWQRPDRYQSEAILLAQPVEGASQYLGQLIAQGTSPGLVPLASELITDDELDRLIEKNSLYSEIRAKQGPQAARSKMKGDISVAPYKDMAIRLSYLAFDPHTAQGVLQSLTALASADSTKSDAEISLEKEILQAQDRLLELGRRLQGFNAQFGSSQQDQKTLTLGELKQWMQRLQSNVEAINRLEAEAQAQRKKVIENQSGISNQGASALAQPGDEAGSVSSEKEQHPLEATTSPGVSSELAQLDAQIEQKKKEQTILRKSLVSYQAKLGTISGLEKAQKQLYDDYETTRSRFHELLSRKAESKNSEKPNTLHSAIRFRILVPPSLPTQPVSPNRLLLSLAGGVIGLLAGVALAVISRGKQKRLVNAEDIVKMTGLPILARIPTISVSPKISE